MAEIGSFEVEDPGGALIRSPYRLRGLWSMSRNIILAVGVATICIVMLPSMTPAWAHLLPLGQKQNPPAELASVNGSEVVPSNASTAASLNGSQNASSNASANTTASVNSSQNASAVFAGVNGSKDASSNRTADSLVSVDGLQNVSGNATVVTWVNGSQNASNNEIAGKTISVDGSRNASSNASTTTTAFVNSSQNASSNTSAAHTLKSDHPSNESAQLLLFQYEQQALTLGEGVDVTRFTVEKLLEHSIKAKVRIVGRYDPQLLILKLELEDELSQLLAAVGLAPEQQRKVLDALARAEAQLPNLSLPKDELKKLEDAFRQLLQREVLLRSRDILDSTMGEEEKFSMTKITTQPEATISEEASEEVSLEPVFLHLGAFGVSHPGIDVLKERVGDPIPPILQESLAHTSESFEYHVLPEPDTGSNDEETSFWLKIKVDELNFGNYLKHASGAAAAASFKTIYQELKRIEAFTNLKMGAVVNAVCADLFHSMHSNIGPTIAQSLQNRIGIPVKHETEDTYNSYASWAQTGRCCQVGEHSLWIAAQFLSKSPQQIHPRSFMARQLRGGNVTMVPSTLDEAGRCPQIDLSRKCAGAGEQSAYQSPWTCSASLTNPAKATINQPCQ